MLPKFSRVLIVDDSATMRKILRIMLKEIGFENVHEASDGLAALDLLNEKRFALVISDWAMKPMNGLALLAEIRKICPLETPPFIIMTAHAVKFAKIARANGTLHYLAKPFTKVELKTKLIFATTGIAA